MTTRTLRFRLRALAAASLLACVPASATTSVTFEDVQPQAVNLAPLISTGGLDFAADGPLADFAELLIWPSSSQAIPPIADNGTSALIWTTSDLKITRQGGAFRLLSADLGLSFNSLDDEQISYSLMLATGGSITGTLDLSRNFATTDFSGISMGQLLNSATFGGGTGYVAIDNVQYEAGVIPEPTTWAMLLFGFACAGTAARYQRRQRLVRKA